MKDTVFDRMENLSEDHEYSDEEMEITNREAMLALAIDFILEASTQAPTKDHVMEIIMITVNAIGVELAGSMAALSIREDRSELAKTFKESLLKSNSQMREKAKSVREENRLRKENVE